MPTDSTSSRRPTAPRIEPTMPWRLPARQVDLALGILLAVAILSGLTSWAVGDRWNGWFTLLHGSAGLCLVLLLPAKVRGSVRTGMRRRRASRWCSVTFGVLVLATVALGIAHATGLWFGVGQWSALWTHELAGFATVPLLGWHWITRPKRPRAVDIDRRGAIGLALTGAAALGIHRVQREVAGAIGLAGGSRRSTGSHEVASHDPQNLPSVIWINDRRPADTTADGWPLAVAGRRFTIDELWQASTPVVATLDCTGGWWSEQTWDAVALSALVAPTGGRSVAVTSSTGYSRRFPLADIGDIHLAVGYGGAPLRPGHGAPVRLVVPGRRGPEWVKWVTRVEVDDRPAWLQLPLPLS